jgi:FkbM family methyltransferase
MSLIGKKIRHFSDGIKSQRGLVLEQALSKHLAFLNLKDEPIFVKVGANDGITGDPCGDKLLRMKKWKGHLIEPIPYIFTKLQKVYGDQRRFKCHQVAISANAGTASIYFLSPKAKEDLPELPYWWDQLASFNSGHIEKHFGTAISSYISTQEVPTLPLRDFIGNELINDFDFLHIDTEGHDLVVLESMDFGIAKPSVVLIEVKHLSEGDYPKVRTILSNAGYKFVFSSGSDLLASKSSAAGSAIILYAWFAILSSKLVDKLSRKIFRQSACASSDVSGK